MIRINCTQCQTTLTIDDAFAGGVCRCQHCGAIQTVPARAKSSRPATPVAAMPGEPPASLRAGSGLGQLTDAIPSSSGLSGTGRPINRVRALTADTPDTAVAGPIRNNHLRPWLIGAGSVIAILLIVVIWMAVHGAGSNPSTATPSEAGTAGISPTTPPEIAPAKPAAGVPSAEIVVPNFGPAPTPFVPPADRLAKPGEPQYYGLRLDGSPVAYVLDRNGSMGGPAFNDLRATLYHSLESLKATQQFRVVFTGKKGEAAVWPQTGFVPASKDNLAAVRKFCDGLKTVNDGDLQPQEAFAKALAGTPAVLVFATSRAGYDEKAASSWLGQNGAKGTKVLGINLSGTNKTSRALKKLADTTHGLYRELSTEDLRRFAQDPR